MKKINYILLLSTIILSIIGVIMIYSSSSIWAEFKYEDQFRYIKFQSVFLIIGIIGMFIISKINYNLYKKHSNILLIGTITLLILVLIPGIGVIRNGSRSWFGIGPFGIQPSELAKITLIIFTAKYLSKNDKELKSIKKGVLPLLIIIGIFFALIMLQPDFGTSMVIITTILTLIFISGVNISFFAKIGILGLIGIVGLIAIAPYRLERITSFLNPWNDPLGTGFQIIQSLYAIGPGGLLGQGFLQSRQKNFYLPEPQTDFIFSIISEEFGFLGILLVSLLFFTIFYQCIKIAINTEDLFAKYLVFGLSFGIIIQTILNLSVVIGLIPVTGVTLPFLSYGGSSLLISLASIGIVLNISKK